MHQAGIEKGQVGGHVVELCGDRVTRGQNLIGGIGGVSATLRQDDHRCPAEIRLAPNVRAVRGAAGVDLHLIARAGIEGQVTLYRQDAETAAGRQRAVRDPGVADHA